jgi:hypothetical protein
MLGGEVYPLVIVSSRFYSGLEKGDALYIVVFVLGMPRILYPSLSRGWGYLQVHPPLPQPSSSSSREKNPSAFIRWI